MYGETSPSPQAFMSMMSQANVFKLIIVSFITKRSKIVWNTELWIGSVSLTINSVCQSKV